MSNYASLDLGSECYSRSYAEYLKLFLARRGIPSKLIQNSKEETIFGQPWQILVPADLIDEAKRCEDAYRLGENFLPQIMYLEEKPIFAPQEGWTTVSISNVPIYAKYLAWYLTDHMLTIRQDEVKYHDRPYWITRVSNSDAIGKAIMMRDKFDHTTAYNLVQLK